LNDAILNDAIFVVNVRFLSFTARVIVNLQRLNTIFIYLFYIFIRFNV
jgi:hypothetical protein